MFLPYAAPEMVLSWKEGRDTFTADPAVDVWALGVRSCAGAVLP
jgi:hypothetical protein